METFDNPKEMIENVLSEMIAFEPFLVFNWCAVLADGMLMSHTVNEESEGDDDPMIIHTRMIYGADPAQNVELVVTEEDDEEEFWRQNTDRDVLVFTKTRIQMLLNWL